MKKLIFILASLSSVVIYFITAAYSLSESDIEDIIICSTNNDTHYIPSEACELYLFKFRAEEGDIQSLESGAGLAFLFGIQDIHQRYIYLEYFLFKGISVDAPSHIDGLPPLHAAVLLNDIKLVKYLLHKGASTKQPEKNYGLTPIEFLHKLNENNHLINREPIAKILTSTASH